MLSPLFKSRGVKDYLYSRGNLVARTCGRSEVTIMHIWMIIGGVVLAGVVIVTIAMIPDLVRYMKIRSM